MQVPNFVGPNGFIWFIGVVENNNDPLQIGRIKVRCYGYHTDDTNDLPTDDLPWAIHIKPTTGGSDFSPTGIEVGATVFGFFADGTVAQYPIVMGVLDGVNAREGADRNANSTQVLTDQAGGQSIVPGVDDITATDGQLQTAWALFADDSQYDISLLPLGNVSATVANYVISNVAEVRLDCVVFASPRNVSSGDVIIGSGSTATDQIIAYRNALPSTSYGVLDSGFKYQYDRYNDKYRWIPLNGDTAGLCARTDYTNDPWFSPGGLNRGQIKNVVKLAHNPNRTDRDALYKAGVNPVVTFPGEGTVLFGDKTLLAKPSAFDRINVRRLFIVMEKAIATAAKFQLFEFNDSFTRAQFKNLVEPFLRDVQGRRGIYDFKVVCDTTNNTGEVIDRNEFVGDIYIKPARSINFIQLNFVAVRTGVEFSEVVGQF